MLLQNSGRDVQLSAVEVNRGALEAPLSLMRGAHFLFSRFAAKRLTVQLGLHAATQVLVTSLEVDELCTNRRTLNSRIWFATDALASLVEVERPRRVFLVWRQWHR